MPRLVNSRKARFKAALVRCGMTQEQWLEKHPRVKSRTHLYLTLKDESQSYRLAAEIDAFIAEVEQKAKAVA